MNPQDYTNRLRHSDYARLLEETGWKIVREGKYVSAETMRQAASAPLWGRFKALPLEDLGATWSHYVARPSPV